MGGTGTEGTSLGREGTEGDRSESTIGSPMAEKNRW